MWAHGFRVSFTPLPGFFSPFPHGTGSLSVSKECLALADGPAGFRQGFTCPALLRVPDCRRSRCAYGAVTLCGGTFQGLPLPHASVLRPYNPRTAWTARVWALPSSLAATGGITVCFLLLPLLRCFSSRRSPPLRDHLMVGLPHSDTRGSKVSCTSPRLFAACRVLRRLLEPGHPPCALLIFSSAGPPPQRRGPRSLVSQHVNVLFLRFP